MKVLYIHPNNDFTGSTRVLSNILSELHISVDVLTRDVSTGCLSGLDNVRLISPCNLEFRSRPIPFLSSIVWRTHIALILLRIGRQYDCFYINTIMPFWAALIGKLYKRQVIYHIHEKFVVKSFEVRLAEYVFDRTKAWRIFVSNYLKNQYKDNGSLSSVIYNRLSTAYLSRVRVRPIESRPRNTITMISSLSRAKGVGNFVALARRLPDLNFILVLSADESAVKNFFEEEFPKNLELKLKLADVGEVIYNTDLLLNLSVPDLCVETFGMTVLEAMAYGVPALVPEVGGPAELIDSGRNGFCIDVTDLSIVEMYIKKSLEINEYKHLSEGAIDKFNVLNTEVK